MFLLFCLPKKVTKNAAQIKIQPDLGGSSDGTFALLWLRTMGPDGIAVTLQVSMLFIVE